MIQLALTIDVSGKDVAAVPTLQAVCRAYGVRPTYFCDHAALHHRDFDRTLNSYHACGRAEVAALFDPWACPPFYRDPREGDALAFTGSVERLALPVVAEKLSALTNEIEDRTGVGPAALRHTRGAVPAAWAPLLFRQGCRVVASAPAKKSACAFGGESPLLRVTTERLRGRVRWPRWRALWGPLVFHAGVRDAERVENALLRLVRHDPQGITLAELADAYGVERPSAPPTLDRDRLRWAA